MRLLGRLRDESDDYDENYDEGDDEIVQWPPMAHLNSAQLRADSSRVEWPICRAEL